MDVVSACINCVLAWLTVLMLSCASCFVGSFKNIYIIILISEEYFVKFELYV